MERMLDENVRKQVMEVFAGLLHPVEILFFGSADRERCEY